VRLKIYQLGGSMPLSDAVPALENFGFRVLAEVPSELGGEDPGTIHDFRLGLPRGEDASPLLARAEPIERAIDAVLNARAEDDVFNRLIVSSGLAAQEADWLRALYRYLRQTSIAFTIYTVVDALRGAPAVTRALIALFRAHHDPAFPGDRAAAAADADAAIRGGLAGGRGDQRRPAAAALLGDDRGDPADQCLRPLGSRGAGDEARFGARAGAAEAGAVARDLRLFAPRRGHPLARRAGRPRRACAGPTGATTSAPKCSG
jgi:hypothetical protein